MSGFSGAKSRIVGLFASGTVIAAAMVAGATPALAATNPAAPTGVSAVDGPGSGEATVTFTPGTLNGGTLSGYTVTPSAAPTTPQACAASGCTVTGLNNGTNYTFTVIETTDVGSSPASSASNQVTPAAVPVISGFNPSTPETFGTTQQLSANTTAGTVTFSAAATPTICDVTSAGVVTPKLQGTCTLQADEAATTTHPAAVSVSKDITIVAVAPGAPTNVEGTVTGLTTASLTFAAPASNGGASIVQYTATSSPGGLTGTCASSPCSVTGLTTGTAYTFTVTAKNNASPTQLTGPASAASNTVRTGGLPQTITFNQPTSPQPFGATPTLSASASPSGLPVSFASVTPTVCTITSAGALTTVGVGTCTIRADQAGNATYSSADPMEHDIAVQKATPTVAVSTTFNPAVYGQPLTFTATTSSPLTTTGNVQFNIDSIDVGSPVALNSSGTASYSPSTPLAVGTHTVKATYAGDSNHNTATATMASVQTINKASTSTAVAVSGDTITATVSPVSPATGTPTGTVSFTVGGVSAGSAPLTSGVATITGSNVGNQAVSAGYAGDTNYLASTGNRAPIGPTVKTHLSSAHPKHNGWYRSPVTVSFTCTPNTAPLSNGCPSPVVKSHNGAGQSVTRTVTATDGGSTTVTVSPINIDQVRPTLTVKRKANGKLVCHAHDTLSHGATCSVHHTTTTVNGVRTVKWRAVAHDKAGNTRHKHGKFTG